MANKKTAKNYFPKINLIFTESSVLKFTGKHQRSFLIGFTSALIILGIVAVSIDAYRNYKDNQRLKIEREKISNEISFWKSASEKYPNFRDAYFKLAILNYQLKDFKKSKEYLDKALRIDPNFKEGRVLEKKLSR